MTKNKKRYLIFSLQLIAAAVLALVDQLIKKAVVGQLKGQSPVVLIPHVIGLRYAENTGAAFSAFSQSTRLLSVVTLVMIVAVIVYLFFAKIENRLINSCVVCIVGGGIGNLIDRFAQGYVVDYVETLFVNFPIYNFADILVTCGVAVLCVYLIYTSVRDGRRKKEPKEETDHENP